jgi:cyclohexanone monooxygenase
VQDRLADSVWMTGGCASWYLDKHGNNTTLWPGFTFEFRKQTRKFDLSAYETTTVAESADIIELGADENADETKVVAR